MSKPLPVQNLPYRRYSWEISCSAPTTPVVERWCVLHEYEVLVKKRQEGTNTAKTAIFRTHSEEESSTPEQRGLLIVKRSPRESGFPGYWVLPGGKVDREDSTVRAAVAREVQEETGLIVQSVLGEFESLRWTDSSTSAAGGEERSKTYVQLNYVVSVKLEMPISLAPDELSAWRWIREDQIDEVQPMTVEMKKVLHDAYRFAKKYPGSERLFAP